ncbi:hypothetical protein ACHQM5_029736 [Ranunculus cassubicifolius]
MSLPCFKLLFISGMKNGEMLGSELDTDDVPTSVAVNGLPSSGLLYGVTSGPRIELIGLLLSFEYFSDVFSSLEGNAQVSSGSDLGDPARLRRRTFGSDFFITM